MANINPYRITLTATDYPPKYDGLLTFLEPFLTEIENGRQGQASLAANFGRYLNQTTGATQNIALNNFRFTGGGAPVNNGDLVTKLYADSLAFNAALPPGGAVGQVPRRGAGSTVAWADWFGDPVPLTAAGTLAPRTAYHGDTTGGAFSVNLPPAAGAGWVMIRDVGLTLAANKLTLVPDGTDKVYGSVQNYEMNVNGETLVLVVDATKGWVRG